MLISCVKLYTSAFSLPHLKDSGYQIRSSLLLREASPRRLLSKDINKCFWTSVMNPWVTYSSLFVTGIETQQPCCFDSSDVSIRVLRAVLSIICIADGGKRRHRSDCLFAPEKRLPRGCQIKPHIRLKGERAVGGGKTMPCLCSHSITQQQKHSIKLSSFSGVAVRNFFAGGSRLFPLLPFSFFISLIISAPVGTKQPLWHRK